MFRSFWRFFNFFLLFYFFLPTKILAAPEFATSYYSQYQVNKDASVSVEHEIRLRNLLANLYVSEYSITLGSNRLAEIWVSDNFGRLEHTVETGPNYTKILVKFKEKVVGKNKENRLKISYKTWDFAFLNGQVLEIGIPSVLKKEDLEDYQVNLVIPLAFGPPSFIQPKPNFEKQIGENKLYFFNKESLLKFSGISAAFGDLQIFNFKLTYHLDNPTNLMASMEIALPPDTAFQHVFYEYLNPAPFAVRVDEDGNWLASFKLKPKEKLIINASGSAELYLREKTELIEPALSATQKAKYLRPQKYWEVDNPEIKDLAEKLKTPQAIYDYLVKNLIYDYGRLEKNSYERLGALQALQNKSSLLCLEFSDLFVTLSRAAGIPARALEGYSYTSNPRLRPLSLNQDILHAWAEYYDERKNLWLPVDPTWGNTTGGLDFFSKLDLNHFVFVRHGLKSYLPLAAGSYTFSDEPEKKQKNVFIEFGQKKKHLIKAEISAQLPEFILGGLIFKEKIYLKNTGEAAFHKEKLSLRINQQLKEINLEVLPPWGTYQIPLTFKTDWLKTQTYLIHVNFNQQEKIYQIKSLPFYQFFWQKIRFLKLRDLLKLIKLTE